MADNWDDYAKEWEKNPATEQFAASVFRQITQHVSLAGTHVLDFGCGTGTLTQKLANEVKDVVALDASEAMIEELDKKQLNNVEPVVDSLTRGLVAQHPAFRSQFDLVVASSVCGFISDFDAALDIIYSLLNPGSQFMHWDWADDDEFTVERLTRRLQNAGFDQVIVEPAFEIDTGKGMRQVIIGRGQR